jgi:hypothetical protein
MTYCHMWPIRPYNIVPHYLINGKVFEKKLNIKCLFSFPLKSLSEIFLIPRRTERDVKTMYIGVQVKHPFFLSCFNQNLILWKEIRKVHKCKFSWKSSIGVRVYPCEWTERQTERRANGRTHMTKLTVAFRNSANAPKNGIKFLSVKWLTASEGSVAI